MTWVHTHFVSHSLTILKSIEILAKNELRKGTAVDLRKAGVFIVKLSVSIC